MKHHELENIIINIYLCIYEIEKSKTIQSKSSTQSNANVDVCLKGEAFASHN
jgi:hypothetical protein